MAACVWQYSLRLQIICSIHFWLDWNDGRCLANSLFNQDKTRSFLTTLQFRRTNIISHNHRKFNFFLICTFFVDFGCQKWYEQLTNIYALLYFLKNALHAQIEKNNLWTFKTLTQLESLHV